MHRALTTFLLWLLIAALPLQGFAAAVQASCAATAHHAAAQVYAPAQSNAGHEHSAHHDSAAASETGAGHDAAAKHTASSCSACASCCVGAGAPPCLSLRGPGYGRSQPVVSSPAPLITGFIPPGLERPPKPCNA
ncbi:MAG: hypothetical protein ABWY05_13955 [Noviherbaspirillum sp.]